jgi:hypothetical protein
MIFSRRKNESGHQASPMAEWRLYKIAHLHLPSHRAWPRGSDMLRWDWSTWCCGWIGAHHVRARRSTRAPRCPLRPHRESARPQGAGARGFAIVRSPQRAGANRQLSQVWPVGSWHSPCPFFDDALDGLNGRTLGTPDHCRTGHQPCQVDYHSGKQRSVQNCSHGRMNSALIARILTSDLGLVVQNHVQQGIVDFELSVVFDEA